MRIVKNTKARVLAIGLLAATFNEVGGYQPFNMGDINIACSIDPTCRKLTDDEIALAEQYFGDSIDYSDVNYFTRPYLWNIKDAGNVIAQSAYGSIYEVRDAYYENADQAALDEVFIHEMGHVWQYQQGHLNPRGDRRAHDHTYDYNLALDEYESFLEYGIEQQATILQRIYVRRNQMQDIQTLYNFNVDVQAYCSLLNNHERLAAQELPIEITDCSQYGYDIAVPDI